MNIKLPFICGAIKNKSGWIRIFGNGFYWKHEKHGLMFTERYGYRKVVKIGKYYFGLCYN
jgi:hypothetical protein